MIKQKLIQIIAFLLILLLLVACGSQDQNQQADFTPVEEPTSAGVVVEEPVQDPTDQPIQATSAPGEEASAATDEPVVEEDAVAEEVLPTVEPQPVANNKLNLNEADGEAYLALIPDFSNRMVREFLEYRPYISIEQFRREIGKYVSQDVVAGYEEYVFVPVNVNESDAPTLMQIPGLDEAAAQLLIDGRSYENNEAFLAKLAEVAPGTNQGLAASYLTTN